MLGQGGAEGIAYLTGEGIYADRTTYPYPQMIIMDLKMPRVNGFEVLQWLKHNPELMVIPTMVWSSSADPSDVKLAYCLGANSYLSKPTDYQKFKEMVGDLFRFWDHCLKPAPGASPTCEELIHRKSAL